MSPQMMLYVYYVYTFNCIWGGSVLNLQKSDIWKLACKLPSEGIWISHGKNLTAEEEIPLEGNSVW